MKEHDLDKELLALPNHEVMIIDSVGPNECDTPYEYIITDDDADMCGCCGDIVCDTVIALSI